MGDTQSNIFLEKFRKFRCNFHSLSNQGDKMKKLIIPMLLLLPSCTIIDIATGFGGIMYQKKQIEKQVKKAESICNEECKHNENLSDTWCDCMHICLNSNEKWNEWRDRNGWWKVENDFTTTIIENGSVKITLNECKSDSTDTN